MDPEKVKAIMEWLVLKNARGKKLHGASGLLSEICGRVL
jgi:hypothetical protein